MTPVTPRAATAAHRATLAAPAADAAARISALRWLAAHAPEALTRADLPLLRDPDLMVRAAATVALRAATDPSIVEAARQSLRDLVLGTLAERHAGLRAAAELANPTLAPRLLPFLSDADPETRRLTLLALAAIPPGLLPPGHFDGAARAALEDLEPGVRMAARALLAAGGTRIGGE